MLDLSEVMMITPSPIVQIAALCHSLAASGRTPTIKLGVDSVRTYLVRCGFFQAVRDVAQVEPAMNRHDAYVYAARRGLNPMLIEVTQMADGSVLPDLLDKIVWALRNRLKYRKRDAFDVATVVSELCQNSFDHNSRTQGFVAMQGYGSGSGRFLEIAVSDCGVGLAATLRRNPKNRAVKTDFDAIQAAMTLGTSEHDDRTRGTGLYNLLEIIYKHKGLLEIKSDSAKIRYRMDKQQGWAFSVTPIPGVHVTVNLSTKAPSRS